MSWMSRFTNVLRLRRVDRDLDDEQRFHLESRIEDLVRDGLTREQAAARAARQFGGRLRTRESSREVKLLPWLESLVRDTRLGARVLRRDATVSAVAVLSLALALGACAAAFSLIDALIFRPLPVRDPNGLVYVARVSERYDERFSTIFSYPHFQRFRDAAAGRAEVFALSFQSLRSGVLPDSSGQEEKLRAQFVSGNALTALGVRPAIGRILGPSDDVRRGAHPVAVLSHAFWMRRLGADPTIVGKWITLEQTPLQIVGVAQPGFTGIEPGFLTDLWAPNMMWAVDQPLDNAQWNWLRVWGRLAPGVERTSLTPLLQTISTAMEREIAARERRPANPPGRAPVIELRAGARGASSMRDTFGRPLGIVGGLVGIVLLIACANVATLLLARGAARDAEMALRASIGAGRRQLLQQVLIEAGLLTLAAAGLGLLFARSAATLIVTMITRHDNPVHLETSLDGRALAFLLALTALTTALFGLGPALRASRVNVDGMLGRMAGRYASQALGLRWLVSTQIAFSLGLVFVAGLLMQSFHRLTKVDVGFSAEHVTLVEVAARDRLSPEQARSIAMQLLETVRREPGVESASLSNWALFRGWSSNGNFSLPGGARAQTRIFQVSPGFFETMRIRRLEGREFESSDLTLEGSQAVIVNEAFARRHFRGEAVVGRLLERQTDEGVRRFRIVGVVANARDIVVTDDVSPYVFEPWMNPDGVVQIRSALDTREIASRMRDAIGRVHPALRITDVSTQSSLVSGTLVRERLLAVLSAFFAGVGLVLAAVGLYGVASYAVVRRTREIGIRLALGARPSAVVRSVLGGVGVAALAGAAGGLLGGLFFSRFVRTLLFETQPLDPWSLAVPAAGLMLVVIIAAGRPAHRAARIDPVVALRAD
jgi:predicted permease